MSEGEGRWERKKAEELEEKRKATAWKGGHWGGGDCLPAAVPEVDTAFNLLCDCGRGLLLYLSKPQFPL